MRVHAAVALLVVAAMVAGCGGAPLVPPTGTVTSGVSAFDGHAAHDLVRGLATHADGAPRYRIPGTAEHAEAATWLAGQLAQPGWTVQWQNFTGRDYAALRKGPIAPYATQCSDAMAAALPDRTFHNLYAVLPGRDADSGHSLVLAAHWDSQPESNFDPDPSKQHLPDPGANDGASGVGVLLQLVRHLSTLDAAARPASTIVVFLTDGEDGFDACYPLAGAMTFAQNATTRALAGQVLLLDMVGDPAARYVREQSSLRSNPRLFDLVWKHGQRVAPAAFTDTSKSVVDDHSAFIAEGVPSIDLIDMGRSGPDSHYGFPPQWDTTDDTMEHIDAGMLGSVGQVVLDTILDPRLEATWP